MAEDSEGSGRGGLHCPRQGYEISFVENEVPGLFHLSPHSLCVLGRERCEEGRSTGQIQSSRKADPGRHQCKLPQGWSSPVRSLPCAELTSSLGQGVGGREGGREGGGRMGECRRTLTYINGLFLLLVSSAEPWPLSGALLPWQIS